METTQETAAFDAAMQGPKRPQFLTVICILSFVWCAVSFLLGIWGVIRNTPENMTESIEQVRQFNPEMADQMEQNMIESQENVYMQVSPYLNFVYILLSFLGVLMMWKLNKKGFYIYLVGELLPYLGFLIAGKQMMSMMSGPGGGMMKGVGMIMLVLMIVFDAAFIIMYGLNLKHMNDGRTTTP
jgi:hypothetical protein